MRVFRYRPLNSLLYKELRYREVYLASPAELNDPLDLNAQIDFAPRDEKGWKALCAFLSRTSVVAHGRLDLIPKLANLMAYDCLGQFLMKTLSLDRDQCLTKKELFEAILQSYRQSVSKLTPLNPVNGEELCDAVDSICRAVIGNSAVACFSETNADFLMWSHYASGHSGVCLEFEAAEVSGNVSSFPVESPAPINGEILGWTEELQRVRYRSTLSMLPFIKFFEVFYEYGDVDLVNLSKSRWHFYAKGISQLFLEKLRPWSTEKEWRIVEVNFKATVPEERIFHYPAGALKGIYFGAKATDATKRRVREALSWSGKPKFYQAIVDGSRVVKFAPDEECE